jgi:multisubunit Na+/H+ antiporter MnhC subunit
VNKSWSVEPGIMAYPELKIGRHMPYLPYWIAGLATLVLAVLLRAIPLTHDVVWQLWIARQLLQGAEIYRDIWEVNPPLWFWSAMPVVSAGDVMGLAPSRLLIALICAVAALSAMLVGKLSGLSGTRQTLLMLICLGIMLIMPIYDFGQREQLALICSLPYAALVACRSRGSVVANGLAATVGLMAAYGFALKHYFVLVPVMLEAWLFLRSRNIWRPVRPETVLLALSAIVYAAAVVLLAPGFLKTVVPMVEVAYNGNIILWDSVLVRPWVCFWMAGSAFFAVYQRRHPGIDPLTQVLLITAIAFAIGYFAQHKGWAYHSIATSGALCVALGAYIARTKAVLPAVSGLIVLSYAVFLPWNMGVYKNPAEPESERILRQVPAGEPVMAIAVDPRWMWPLIEKYGLLWPSRLYSYWMIPTLTQVRADGPPSPRMERLGERIREETALEMRCMPPALILFEKPRGYAPSRSLPRSCRPCRRPLRAGGRSRRSHDALEALDGVGSIRRACRAMPVNTSATWNGCDRKRWILRARATSACPLPTARPCREWR